MITRRHSPFIVVLILLFVAGCSDDRALNEKNTFYKRAEEARKAERVDAAIDNYRSCLFYSPKSHKAHLQLAILLEENKKDLPGAITHYTAYLAAVGGNDEEVSRMLRRVEKKYYCELRDRYRDEVQAAKPAIAPAPKPAPPPPKITPAPKQKPKPRYYVVQTGDNLSRISNKVYGTAQRWELIYNANRRILPTPGRLRVGMTLIIPERSGTAAPGGNN